MVLNIPALASSGVTACAETIQTVNKQIYDLLEISLFVRRFFEKLLLRLYLFTKIKYFCDLRAG